MILMILVFNTITVVSQNRSIPLLRIYKSNKSITTIPLKEIDSLAHLSIVPVTLTLEVKNITYTSALFEATILSKGEGTLGECGFCWSKTEYPTINSNRGNNLNNASNSFSNVYSLIQNRKYYVRAFASNEVGVSYSNQIEFTTPNIADTVLEIVKIGTQIWKSKNLDVSTYRNGDSIRHASTPEEWQDAASKGEGAWCYYNHDPKNGEIYGKLYNWYSVKDSRGLAPSGFHIPSDLEWSLLVEYLGGEEIAGFKMKSTSGWSNDGNGDNSCGFNGQPGGFCNYDGDFYFITVLGYWWSSSENNSYDAWNRYLFAKNTTVYRYLNDKDNGYSVRCIKD